MGLKLCSLIYKSIFAYKYYQSFIIHCLNPWEDKKNLTFKTLIFGNFWGPEVVGSNLYQKSICMEFTLFYRPSKVRRSSWTVTTLATLTFIATWYLRFRITLKNNKAARDMRLNITYSKMNVFISYFEFKLNRLGSILCILEICLWDWIS